MKFYKFLAFVLTLGLMLGGAAVPSLAAPTATMTVTTTSDLSDLSPGDGFCDTLAAPGQQCSLRAAIEEVNALGARPNPHVILFYLSGPGPFTLAPASPLPSIAVPVTIDGTTQPGASCASETGPAQPQIVLDGSSAGTATDGLILNTGSDGSTVSGLVIGNFTNTGIRINSNSSSVYCSFIGIGADGETDMGNTESGIMSIGTDTTIGGAIDISRRNVISNNFSGIRLEGLGTGAIVRNNFIGTNADGTRAQGNSYGIYISSANNRIGGNTALASNLISGNIGPGIRINVGQSNLVRGNWIGLAADGITPLQNGSNGIEILGDAYDNTIGGSALGQANRIAFNGINGVALYVSLGIYPIQNTIRFNEIYENVGLGIDLGLDGVDSNDSGDLDNRENKNQNYPVLLASSGSPEIVVSLDSRPNLVYNLDFYRNDQCDASGHGEGQQHLYETTLTTDNAGLAETSVDLSTLVNFGDAITATATDPDGNTSEFSACVIIPAPESPSYPMYLPIMIQ